jgi:hypothetical protein
VKRVKKERAEEVVSFIGFNFRAINFIGLVERLNPEWACFL